MALDSASYEVISWIDESETAALPYADYWNNEALEEKKVYLHLTRLEDRERVDAYLTKTGINDDLAICLKRCPPSGIGADLAAGICWPTPQILAFPQVKQFYCVEYSRHRLTKSAPLYLASYQVDPKRVKLALGSFYEIKLPDKSLDFILLASSLHHADAPEQLLGEVRRLLKDDGRVIVIGEPVVYLFKRLLTYYARLILGNIVPVKLHYRLFGKELLIPSKWIVNRADLLAPDPLLGDHWYPLEDYLKMFKESGFLVEHFRSQKSPYRSFLLRLAK